MLRSYVSLGFPKSKHQPEIEMGKKKRLGKTPMKNKGEKPGESSGLMQI